MIDKMHIVHPGRACRHARETGQASINMLHNIRCRRLSSLKHGFDEINSPARTIEFITKQQIGRARGGTKPAMDTSAQYLFRRLHRRIFKLLRKEISFHRLNPVVHPGRIQNTVRIKSIFDVRCDGRQRGRQFLEDRHTATHIVACPH